MLHRVVLTGFFLATLAGCSREGSYRVLLVFPDDLARESIHRLALWALQPGGRDCQELISGKTDPDEMIAHAEHLGPYPPDEPVVLARVPSGMILFAAEGRTSEGAKLLRGCRRQAVRGGERNQIPIELQWVCGPEIQDEVPANGQDDDCDGLTDECQVDRDCRDDNACTLDLCVQEECHNPQAADGVLCNDGDACTREDQCLEGLCQGSAKDCSAFDQPCREGNCDPRSGQCQSVDLEDGTGCDDGLTCTVEDACRQGICSGAERPCDDGDICTLDGCNEAEGCVHTPQPVPGAEGLELDTCDNQLDDDCDGLTDTEDPNCRECTSDGECDDDNPCTLDRCEIQCHNEALADGTPCQDGLFCTRDDACLSGVCLGAARDCSALDNDCNLGVCVEAQDQCQAQSRPDGTGCDDGVYCTAGDQCQGGACQGGGPRDCDDDDRCTQDSCNEDLGLCQHAPQQFPGTEGLDLAGSCDNLVDDDCDGLTDEGDPDCLDCIEPADCDDGNDCTLDDCEAGTCVHQPQEGSCDDGLYCTDEDYCLEGTCTGSPRDCSFLTDQCNTGRCDEQLGICLSDSLPYGTECDDASACTSDDICTSGECQGTPIDCSHLTDPCNTGQCQEGLGCVAEPEPDGTQCDDGDVCTESDDCQAGSCRGAPKDCSHLDDQCHLGDCQPVSGDCIQLPLDDGTSCEDGQYCTVDDECLDGVCTGSPRDCSDGDDCTADICDDYIDQCVHTSGAESMNHAGTCTNGADDDCDGFTDMQECDCHALPQMASLFENDYAVECLGPIPDLPVPYGALVHDTGDAYLVGGSANDTSAGFYRVYVLRDANGHLTGFDGNAAHWADAPYLDGGADWTTGPLLFYTRWPNNEIGQINHSTQAIDKVLDLQGHVASGSPGSLRFWTNNHLKVVTYAGDWYAIDLAEDGSGTFDIAQSTLVTSLPNHSEGIVYLFDSAPVFDGLFGAGNSVLVAEYVTGSIVAYSRDASGDPDPASREVVASGMGNIVGLALDPASHDLLTCLFDSQYGFVFVVRAQGKTRSPPRD